MTAPELVGVGAMLDIVRLLRVIIRTRRPWGRSLARVGLAPRIVGTNEYEVLGTPEAVHPWNLMSPSSPFLVRTSRSKTSKLCCVLEISC